MQTARLSSEQPAGPDKSWFYPTLASTWKSWVHGHLEVLTRLSFVRLLKLLTEAPVSWSCFLWHASSAGCCKTHFLRFDSSVIFKHTYFFQLFIRINSCNSLCSLQPVIFVVLLSAANAVPCGSPMRQFQKILFLFKEFSVCCFQTALLKYKV